MSAKQDETRSKPYEQPSSNTISTLGSRGVSGNFGEEQSQPNPQSAETGSLQSSVTDSERRFSKLWSNISVSSNSSTGRPRADTLESESGDVVQQGYLPGSLLVGGSGGATVEANAPTDVNSEDERSRKGSGGLPYRRIIYASAVVLLLAAVAAVVAAVLSTKRDNEAKTVPVVNPGLSFPPTEAPSPSNPSQDPAPSQTLLSSSPTGATLTESPSAGGGFPAASAAPTTFSGPSSPTVATLTESPSAGGGSPAASAAPTTLSGPSSPTATSVLTSAGPSLAPSYVPSSFPSLLPSIERPAFPITCTNSQNTRVRVFVNVGGSIGRRRCARIENNVQFYCGQQDQSGDNLASDGTIPFVWQVCQIECEEWALGVGAVAVGFPGYTGCPTPLR